MADGEAIDASHKAGTRVVAVVLNWNGLADTIECLGSLLRSQRVPDQIVVCDNGSIDGSFERLKEWARARPVAFEAYGTLAAALEAGNGAPLVFIQLGGNLGYAGGNNAGIRFALERAGSDFVWIVNNDVVVDPAALDAMLAVAQADPAAGIVGSKILTSDRPHRVQVLGGGHILPFICHDTQIGAGTLASAASTRTFEVGHLIGANLLVRAAAVHAVGPIDESYFLYREETDWCIRMRHAGWRLYCCGAATVWHKQSRSIGFKSPLHDYYAVRNMLRLVKKFYPRHLPAAYAYFACRSILPKIVRLEFARLRSVVLALRDFSRGVAGRPAHHTDAEFIAEYVAKNHERAVARPAHVLRAARERANAR